ncbi:hypothetical protein [Actinoplanes auranticolor]|uniref:VCBS repeat protein n=1 Tax=Actinoplanes auranticolor TaxID=47988 RepID=A0A919SQB8_9ACTN|nr:hypothetical protein [Actinoplanes auranticolor]GIM76597.1 hypothetical protein Aau02nite_71730 [Actinoplanes auranticolor]
MRQVKNKLTLLALTACTIAATAACSAPSDKPSDAPIAAPPASSGAGSAASQAAGPAPSPTVSPTAKATTRPAAPAEEPSAPSTGQGGQSTDTDWAKAAFRALGCKRHADLPKRAELQQVEHADLTGDGRRDTIVAGSCPTTTSTNAVHVFVFGAGSATGPLLTIGKDSYLRTADLRTKGRSLTVESEALSDDAPLCCPDLRITQSWKWTGSAFTRTAFKSSAL